jgi:hypothetical protein
MEIVFGLEEISVDAFIYPLIADLPRIIKLYPIGTTQDFKTKEYPMKIKIFCTGEFNIGVKLISITSYSVIINNDYSSGVIGCLGNIEKVYKLSLTPSNSLNRKYPLYQLLENVYVSNIIGTAGWKEYALVFVKTHNTRLIIIRDNIIIYQSIGTSKRVLIEELLADMNAGRTELLELPIERIKSARK